MTVYEPHELSMLFPSPTETEFRALCGDIRANGLNHKILVWENKIISGVSRERACIEVGVEPEYEFFEGDLAAARARALSDNLYQRHFTTSQRAMMAGVLATIPHGGDRKSDQAPKSPFEGLTIKEAAKLFKVGETAVKYAHTVLHSDDADIIADVRSGKISVSRAAQKVRAKPGPTRDQGDKSEEAPGGSNSLERSIYNLTAEEYEEIIRSIRRVQEVLDPYATDVSISFRARK